MRSRSNSGVRLDYYQRLLTNTVLAYQDPVTGLFSTSQIPAFAGHAWVRDNCYAVHSIWGLALAYRKQAEFDEDQAKAYELEQICVKVMRSLLFCMMRQIDKVEKFKKTQSKDDCLHAKYSAKTLQCVVGDFNWGHLQIDATSLFLLTLAQMTASGLQIIFNLDEVSFIQNLVFYIENAYRIPEFGIWERGDKTNHGVPELNASSIGMAKAALQALNDLDLFGAYGSALSVIHVLADEMQQCQAVLQSMLPWESCSKEVDAALLSVISYPAFACEDPDIIRVTKQKIVDKLKGRYGCKRFLRDGFKCVREDPNRLYYEPWELQLFENIECEWPLFFCYFILDGLYTGDEDQVKHYRELLDATLVRLDNGLKVVPELYVVPVEDIEAERADPGTQSRVVSGCVPYVWAQSLYILGCLIEEGFLQTAEVDPLNRRLAIEKRPDTVVQVVVLAADKEVQENLAGHGIKVDTVDQADPFVIQPASVLGKMYAQLGRNEKLNLSGRPSQSVGLLSTSKLYMIDERIFCFTPQFLDWESFYWTHDINILVDIMKNELFYLKTSWNVPGRPLFLLVLTSSVVSGKSKALGDGKKSPTGVIGTLRKLKSGYLSGTRHHRANIPQEIDTEIREYLESVLGPSPTGRRSRLPSRAISFGRRISTDHKLQMSTVRGLAQRHRSIMLQPDDEEVVRLRAKYGGYTSQSSCSPTSSMFQSGTISPSVVTTGMTSPTDSAQQSGGATPTTSSPHESTPTSPNLLKTSEFFSASEHPLFPIKSESSLQELDCQELVETLMETDSLEEQADIIHYLWLKKGGDWDTELGGKAGTTVRKLVEDLYEKACHGQLWWLVRHTAGLLYKRIDDLAPAVTDLLVRQKQLTVGMPAIREEAITRPLPPEELQRIVRDVFGDDISSAMLTQELLIYLGMFVRTEPQLFAEMLRLRVGLIIQVMASELARALHISADDASQQLLNLSPYEMKTLLHHILSGKEFGEVLAFFDTSLESKTSQLNRFMHSAKSLAAQHIDPELVEESDEEFEGGQWLRRRRIDGALNRVPPDFYSKVWNILRKCEVINIQGHILHQNLTKEMTRGEIKFALTVESVMNRIPEPEYRQLLVEALMVLTMAAEVQTNLQLGPGQVNVHEIVKEANRIFVAEHAKEGAESVNCCGAPVPVCCGGAAGICKLFYDMAPSGRFGTLTFMCRAVANLLHHSDANIECTIS